ncbi:L-cysteine desulfidase family protein [Mediterraneibacter sp. 210702-DFI.5.30]|uniref:L-cysteine desulfidase family protein n=1 Tax=Mediterraneibacter sp. 210702-DFI.5.30 TaxID=2883232 RepID=UPI001D074071|nr:L-serine ammonia-lyase, iron-sulfur-dependent, subunit alpha [Mediterraneibacter sp. 210702-DFI.5.30]MCB6621106.1 L-serine ammonia-lyase, iron-sulfur-dependent, subunit alpha [Mediterraneibacter sp. 210702-DFI.5.30]
MHELSQMIKDDMKPALGVTEPGAIAFAVAKARSFTKGDIKKVNVAMNSGMYKNAFTCGIPNSNEVGNVFAAALGVVAGNADKGLESLADVTPEDNVKAQEMIDQGKITVELSGITSRIFIEATVETEEDKAIVTIRDSHTNITKIIVNDKVELETEDEKKTEEDGGEEESHSIHKYTLQQLYDYVTTVDIEEIRFINEAYKVNLELFHEGLENPRTTFARQLLAINNGKEVSDDEQKTASLMCNAAIEARVIGLDKPAMSITGSGAHGIIATMPLYAAYKVNGYTEEQLLRATALSYLVCMYIKEYSGRLSAFCGCAIAAGSGMACALVYLRGGTVEMMAHTLNNMASSITGMICDGGNQGCTMKGVAAVDAAYKSVEFAMNGIYISEVHGINGNTPEETMRNMGLIASPGMVGTEKTIIEIFEDKLKK